MTRQCFGGPRDGELYEAEPEGYMPVRIAPESGESYEIWFWKANLKSLHPPSGEPHP
jgi:hypothetical protein